MNSVHTFPTYTLHFHSNTIFPYTPMSSEWSLPFRFPDKNVVWNSLVRATCLSHPILLGLITLMTFGEAYKLRSSSSPASCHFLPLRSKYSPQHPVFKHNLCPSPSVRDQVSSPYKITGIIMVLCILVFKILEMRWEDKRMNKMAVSILQI